MFIYHLTQLIIFGAVIETADNPLSVDFRNPRDEAILGCDLGRFCLDKLQHREKMKSNTPQNLICLIRAHAFVFGHIFYFIVKLSA